MIFSVPSVRDQHVGRLEVAVDQAGKMGGVDRSGEHLDGPGGFSRVHRSAAASRVARVPPPQYSKVR